MNEERIGYVEPSQSGNWWAVCEMENGLCGWIYQFSGESVAASALRSHAGTEHPVRKPIYRSTL